MNRNKRKEFLRSYHHTIIIILIIFIFLFGYAYLYNTKIIFAKSYAQQTQLFEDYEEIDFHKKNQILTEELKLGTSLLRGIGISFTSVNRENEGTIQIEIMDKTKDVLLFSNIISMDTINGTPDYYATFPEEHTDMGGHVIEVTLTILSTQAGNDLKIIINDQSTAAADAKNSDSDQSTQFVQVLLSGTNTFIEGYFAALWTCVTIFVLLLYILVFVKKAKIETVFLFTVVLIGIIYSFFLTPYSAPDETAHIDTTFYYSNKLLGIADINDEKIYRRVTEANVGFEVSIRGLPTMNSYRFIYENVFAEPESTELVETSADVLSTMAFVYAPGILGVTLARLLQLNGMWTLMIGSWFNLLGYAFLVYFGMKKLPFGKLILFFLATLPMSLQQAASFSYDAVIAGITLLFFCYVMHAIYKMEIMKPKDIAILAISALLISWSKGGVYLPLVFLVVLIPKKVFKNKKQYYLVVGGIIGIMIAGFLGVSLSALLRTNAGKISGEKIVTWAGVPGFTIADVIRQPKYIISMLFNTFFFQGGFYLDTMIGSLLGPLTLEIFPIMIYMYGIALVLTCFRIEGEPQYLKIGQKTYMGILCAGSILLIVFSMLLDWTPKGYGYVVGVQGRYLLPLALPILLLFRNSQLTYKKSPEKFYLVIYAILQVLMVISFLLLLM